MAKFEPKSNITLQQELPYIQNLPKDRDLFDGPAQQLVLAKTKNEDIMFWISLYLLDGRTDQGFHATDACTNFIQFYEIPRKDRGKMSNNDFINDGFSPAHFLKTKDLKVKSTANKAVLKFQDTEFVIEPPYWTVKGKQAGVEYDLKCTGSAPTFYYVGDFKDILKTMMVCFDQFTKCEGTVKFKGKKYEIVEGYGVHEHPVVAAPHASFFGGEPMYWNSGWADGGFQFFHFGFGDLKHDGRGVINADGKFLHYKEGDVSLHVLDKWYDPRSMVHMPCKWHIDMANKEGVLDIDVVAQGRSNYLWAFRNGYFYNSWIMGLVNGRFIYPNGKMLRIKDGLSMFQWGKNMWP